MGRAAILALAMLAAPAAAIAVAGGPASLDPQPDLAQ